MRAFVFAMLLMVLSPAAVSAQTIDVHSFVKGDCSQDDSSGFQSALNTWATQGGTLDLGTVCISLNEPVKVALPNAQPTFGTIRGDGPNLAQIKCANGIGRCLELDQWWTGTFSGVGVTGGGYGTLNAGNNHDIGLVLSNSVQDLGSCCGTISNVSVGGFARCWQFGDDQAPLGAAAEFVLDNVGGNYCGGADGQYSNVNGGLHCGGDGNDVSSELARAGGGTFWFGSYNTLDFVFNKGGSLDSGTTFCMGYGGPAQFSLVGGGATNNQHELNMQGDCTDFFITSYRAEGGPNADGAIPLKSGGCPGSKLTVVNSTLRATSVYSPVSIQIDNADTQTFLINNNLVGQVQMVQGIQTIYAYGNTILTQGTDPFGFSDPNCCGAMRIYTAGNRNASNVAGMWPTDWWPDNLQGYWMYPPNQNIPTPTPLPLTPVPTATPVSTSTPVPTLTPTPTSGNTSWIAPTVLSTTASLGGDASCIWRTTCSYVPARSGSVASAFDQPYTFNSVRFIGTNNAGTNVYVVVLVSTDGIHYSQSGVGVMSSSPDPRSWTITLPRSVTASYMTLQFSNGGISIGSTRLLAPVLGAAPTLDPKPSPKPTHGSTPTTAPTQTPVATACPPSLQALIDAAPAGSTLKLPACIFRETISVNKPLILDGQGKGEIRGSDVWSAWNQNGTTWTSTLVYPNVGNDSTAGTAPCNQGGPCYLDYFRAFNLEQVFLDGVPLTHVPSSPVSGQFTLDSNRHVILANNPNGHMLEVTTRKRWVNTQSDNVTITNMVFHHAATGAFESSVSSDIHKGFVLSNSLMTDAHGSMVGAGGQVGSGERILNNTLQNAGTEALGGYQGDGILTQGNTFIHNGYGGWDPNWEAGAVKFVANTNLTLDSNTVSDTFGLGLWCDIACNGVTISNNKVHDTTDTGIQFEISNHAHIYGNAVWNVGARWNAPSLYVSNSGDTEVDHNTIYAAAGNALFMYDANRPDTGVVENNYFHDNVVIQTIDANYKALGFEDYGNGVASMPDEHGSNNAFWYPDPEDGSHRYSWGQTNTASLVEFNATPGGGGNSYYLSDAQRDAVLTTAGIPH